MRRRWKPWLICLFFFFQAEGGIRGKLVTGVQTCALPIFGVQDGAESKYASSYYPIDASPVVSEKKIGIDLLDRFSHGNRVKNIAAARRRISKLHRSEERRVGKECRTAWGAH